MSAGKFFAELGRVVVVVLAIVGVLFLFGRYVWNAEYWEQEHRRGPGPCEVNSIQDAC